MQEAIQRLFEETKPKDEFTQWCENFLKGLQANIDGEHELSTGLVCNLW